MTSVDVSYRYTTQPDELTMRAIGALREVYGIRKMQFDESAQTVLIEYDATRLDEPEVSRLLRSCGLDISSRLSLA